MKSKPIISLILFLLDTILLAGLFYLFTVLRTWSTDMPELFWRSAFVVVVMIWLVFYVIDAYSSTTDMISLSYTSQHILAVFVALIMTIIAIYAFTLERSHQFSRSVLFATYTVFLPLSIYYRRFFTKKIITQLKDRFFLVLGISDTAKAFYEDYRSQPGVRHKLRFIDLLDEERLNVDSSDNSFTGKKILPDIRGLIDERCGGIILSENNLSESLMEELSELNFRHIPVMPIEAFYEVSMKKVHIPAINHHWLLEEGFILVGSSTYGKVKRLADLLLSSFVLILASPLFVVIPVLIRLDSRGPAIFKQKRVGKDKSVFTLYKFRTMEVGAHKGSIYTAENDARITNIGRLLRKLRLDELPQLWNVVKGEMSIMGPRAEWTKCTEEYEREIPYYHFRHLVKPGITGWAQVNYPYGENLEDTVRKLEYDLYYVRHHSLILDANIALKTIYVMLFGMGAK